MGRIPRPVNPQARSFPNYPIPAPSNYSDEVSEKDVEALKELVREDADSEKWEEIDGPAW